MSRSGASGTGSGVESPCPAWPRPEGLAGGSAHSPWCRSGSRTGQPGYARSPSWPLSARCSDGAVTAARAFGSPTRRLPPLPGPPPAARANGRARPHPQAAPPLPRRPGALPTPGVPQAAGPRALSKIPGQTRSSRPAPVPPDPSVPAPTPGPIRGCASIRLSPPPLAAPQTSPRPRHPAPARPRAVLPGPPPPCAVPEGEPTSQQWRDAGPERVPGAPIRAGGRGSERQFPPSAPWFAITPRRGNGDSPRFGPAEPTGEARLHGAAAVGPGPQGPRAPRVQTQRVERPGDSGVDLFRVTGPCAPTQPWARVLTSPAYCFSVLKYRCPSVLTSPNRS